MYICVVEILACPSNSCTCLIDAPPSSKWVAKLCLSDGELSALIGFISRSFFRDKSGNLLELQKGIYGDSQFYSGVGDFYLMNMCNRWTAKGLKSIGMDISPTLKLTAGSVMNYLTKANIALTIESTRTCKNGV